jgi:hypothetical protein
LEDLTIGREDRKEIPEIKQRREKKEKIEAKGGGGK